MTYREAMLLLIDKTDRAVEAVKILRAIDSNYPVAESRAEKLIRIAINETSRLTDNEKMELSKLIHSSEPNAGNRTEVVRFRVTQNEKAAIKMLADKYAGGNMSQLIVSALTEKYSTL